MGRVWVLIVAFGLIQGCVSASKYKDLEGDHKKLQSANQGLQQKNSENEIVIAQLQSQLGAASSDVAVMRKALQEAAKRKKEIEKRIKEYKALVSRFKRLIDAGQLSVKIVAGRMVVGLESDILFSSGSARLSDEGKSSLEEVAKLLASIPGKEYQIEGHTDNVPIRTAVYPSNWELASARALVVLKAMTNEGMPPARISLASFGENKPAASNSTAEGKSANRRIEIVILPDLSNLPGFEELQRLSEEAEKQEAKVKVEKKPEKKVEKKVEKTEKPVQVKKVEKVEKPVEKK